MMGRHLSDNDLNGYIHQTLTDAQRESMDRHLIDCPTCRARMDAAKQLQQHIRLELDTALRHLPPSTQAGFRQTRANLHQRRRRALFRFHSVRLLSKLGTLGAVMVLGAFAFYLLQFWSQTSVTQVETASAALFDVDWNDTSVFASGLVAGEQSILETLPQTTIYHLDVHVGKDLHELNGRQQIRYVNNTEQPLDDIYLRLLANIGDSQLTVANVLVNGRVTQPTTVNTSTISIDLPRTLAPGQTALLEMDFTLLVGRSRRTFDGAMGLLNDVLGLAYWHPMVAVFADGNWQAMDPVYGISGATDKSYFLVRVTAPRDQTLITSGIEVQREPATGPDDPWQEVTFAAGPVDLFYLTMSHRYQAVLSQNVGDTRINSYAYADYLLDDAQHALTYAVTLLTDYTDHYGMFPFAELDLVGTPNLNYSRMSVSYPGVSLLSLNSHVYGQASVDAATSRQIAYQWFGRIVGNQALKEPWLAAAVTEYVTLPFRTLDDEKAWGEWYYTEDTPPKLLGLPTTAYENGEFEYVMMNRGTAFLTEMEARMGSDAFTRFLRAYYQQFIWGGATTAAFQRIAEEQCVCDLTPLFQEWVYGSN